MHPANHPLWTDYLSAFGTVVGIVIAGAAFVIAKRSAADATHSAESAERTAGAAEAIGTASASTLEAATEQLLLAKLEHERLQQDRARRPVVDRIELKEIQPRPGEEAPSGVFRVGFSNSGERGLTDAALTILLDPGSNPALTTRWGNRRWDQSRDETQERWPGVDGDPRAFDYLVVRANVPVGESCRRYVCATRFGRFPLRIKLFSAALRASGPWIDAWVDIEKDGRTTITHLPDDARRPHEGRCEDFE